MRWRWIRSIKYSLQVFFSFSLGLTRRERIGIMIIFPAGLLMLLVSEWYDQRPLQPSEIVFLESELLDWEAEQENSVKEEIVPLSPFNPDTISFSRLVAWKIPDKTAGAWVNYRQAAGGSISDNQIRKLYGMNDSLYLTLAPFLQRDLQQQPEKRKTEPIDMNLSDTLLWSTLRGIGPVLSRRAVAYRELLGGYVEKNQLLEVYGIDSALFASVSPHIYVDPHFIPRRLDLARDSYARLRAHPYLSSREASAIVNYRSQHSTTFQAVDELYLLINLDSSTINRIKPYVLPVENEPASPEG